MSVIYSTNSATRHTMTYDLDVYTAPVALWIKQGKDVTVEPKNGAVKV
jgi:hypothetical protein